MLARTLKIAMIVLVLGTPLIGLAAVPDPFIYSPHLVGMPQIVGAPYGTLQTAVRAGDTPTLQVFVHSTASEAPTISAGLSDFGLSGSATTSGAGAGSGAQYYPAYFYNFGPLMVPVGTTDGVHTIQISATDSLGNAATATTSVLVDTVPPIVTLSSITFSTTSPQQGDFMYLSGRLDGTGSSAKASQLKMSLTDGAGNPVVSTVLGGSTFDFDPVKFNAAIATSTDGSFSNIPVQLIEFGDIGWISRAAKLRMTLTIYDEAGNSATGSLTVSVPKPAPPDPCAAPGSCASNVLFLPGIEGSRLYEGTGCGKSAEEKLWEPFESAWRAVRGAGDDKVKRLALDSAGLSVCSDMYAKEGDVIDSVGGSNVYASLIDKMNGLKADKTIADWKPVAYDWRLSLPELLSKGTLRAGKIYYEEATSTPYIEQTLRALAATSKTKKVTIIAHSNGGLVTKALLSKLGNTEAAKLVDKIIMVGVPQTGAPVDIGALLFGLDQGISSYGISILHSAIARALAQNSPMAYHLLPSESYLASIIDEPTHPVVHFAGEGYTKERAAYGNSIVGLAALDDFLLAKNGERVKPKASDVDSAEILNPVLISYANSQHAALDSWVPPAGIEVDQIAGWGVDTVAGVDFYTPPPTSVASALAPLRRYRPIFIEDGDGTVPVPSALSMASSTNVKRYWVNLRTYNKDTNSSRTHKDLFEVPSLQDFIKNIVKNSTSTLPTYISSSRPPSATETKKLTFFLHSPLTLQLTDFAGNVTGLATDDSVTQNIPGSTYGEFGEVKYVTVPEGGAYQLTMRGQASGTFSLDMQESLGGVITASSTIADVPTTASTLASLTLTSGLRTASALTVDTNGDSKNIVTILPKVGETVSYSPPMVALVPAPALAPAPSARAAGGPGYSPYTPLPITASTSTATSSPIIPAIAATTSPAAITPVIIPVILPATTTVSTANTSPLSVATPRVFRNLFSSSSPAAIVPTAPKLLQTASVYEASQQSVFKKLGAAVYTKLHGFWVALKKLF